MQIIVLPPDGSSDPDEGSNEEDGEDEHNALDPSEGRSITRATPDSNDEA